MTARRPNKGLRQEHVADITGSEEERHMIRDTKPITNGNPETDEDQTTRGRISAHDSHQSSGSDNALVARWARVG